VVAAISYLLAVVLVFHPQDVAVTTQYICLSPKGLSSQSQLMNIYDTVTERN
jgi:hypothetical protein